MKIFVWTTIVISYLFILFAVLPVRLFLVQTSITNQLDKEIFVTPIGRVRSKTTTTIPLEFKFPGISNPFNKQISVKPNQTIQLYHDNDACMFEGLLISKSDSLFKVRNDKRTKDNYTISNTVLTDTADTSFDSFTRYKFGDFTGFSFQFFLLLYAPIMTVTILTKRFKK